MSKYYRLFFVLVLFLLYSCTDQNLEEIESSYKGGYAITKYSKTEALEHLSNFLIQHKSEFLQTKSGNPIEVKSITPIYSNLRGGIATKADGFDTPEEGSEYSEVIGYTVNFEDDGFAILGAVDTLPPIIAVVSSASIDSITLEVSFIGDDSGAEPEEEDDMNYNDLSDSTYYYNPVTGEDNLINASEWEDFDWYDEEDCDWYMAEEDCNAIILTRIIRRALSIGYYPNGNDNLASGTGNATVNYSIKVDPLVSTQWGQGLPYNNYCKRGIFKNKQAKTGCSTTALAQIMAYNQHPSILRYNGYTIDWEEIGNSEPLTDTEIENVSRLMASIYYSCTHISTKEFTLITPEQIKKHMINIGYRNVTKHSANSYTNELQRTTINMLRAGKPVFISALGDFHWNNFEFDGHSWIIDGCDYTNNQNLVHCNWGWSGNGDIYFAATGLKYDDLSFNWHFRIITYDI